MIKLDIISGFLGAGKTTFIKLIIKALEEKKAEKVVLIINEFGDIGIDGDLINHEEYTMLEISKGCLCCSLKEDFSLALKNIAKDISPDRVILEPSGIFVVQEAIELLKQDELSKTYSIENIITIVDAINYHKSHGRIGLFLEKQIQSASTLILSKIQYIPEEDVDKIAKELSELNSKAEIYSKEWSQYLNADILQILDCNGEKTNFEDISISDLNELGHDFSSYGINTQMVFNSETVEKLLADMKNEKFGKIIRSKGILLGTPQNMEFHYVEGNYSYEPFCGEITAGKMIFIGKGIKKRLLKLKYYKRAGRKNVTT